MKKGIKRRPGCRCKNCCNAGSAVASTPGTQQQSPVEILEVKQDELLHDNSLSREYGEEWVRKEKGDDHSEEDDEGEEDIDSDNV